MNFSNLSSYVLFLVGLLLSVLFAISPFSVSALNFSWILLAITVLIYSGVKLITRRVDVLDLYQLRSIKIVAAFFFLGLFFKLVAQAYWGVVGEKLAFELNAFVASLVALVSIFISKPKNWMILIALSGFSLASFVVSSQISLFGDSMTPTNAVNWVASIALVLCVLLAWLMDLDASILKRYVFCSAGLLLIAVLISGRRGSYPVVLWLVFVLVFMENDSKRYASRLSFFGWLKYFSLTLFFLLILFYLGMIYEPIARVEAAISEILEVLNVGVGLDSALQSSVGSRLYQYSMAIDQVKDSPWLGIGLNGKDTLVQSIEKEINFPLHHLHNEYLDAWVAYGLLGLISKLMFPAGLILAGWNTFPLSVSLSVALLGLGFVHFIVGMTNVNTFHNYYQTMFAITLVMAFISTKHEVERV